jgi:hypothetical protein
MKTTIKTEKVLKVYQILNTTKYGKLDDADKVKVWKIARKLKPVATKFDEDSKDAAEKLKPYEGFEDDLQKAQEYERLKGVNAKMDIDEYQKFIAAFKAYQELVGKAVKEYADVEVEVEFDTISEDAFSKLMASNEWTLDQAVEIGEFITE